LLEKVRVIGVGRVLRGAKNSADQESYSASDDVTLDVSLSQAQTLLGAEEKGQLRLVLRHPEDEGVLGPPEQKEKRSARSVARAEQREIEHVR
jgi:Flp pilus assembly protein CpaB